MTVHIESISPHIAGIVLNRVRTCWLVRGARTLLVDTGFASETPLLLEGLTRLGMHPGDIDLVALTHIHVDHAGGAGHLAPLNAQLEFRVHPEGAKHLADPAKLEASVRRAYGDRFSRVGALAPIVSQRIQTVTSGDRIDLGGVKLDVYHAPGHARHHVVFYDAAARTLFSGDALGSRYPGLPSFILTPPPDYDKDLARATIDFIEHELSPRCICFTHCGAHHLNGREDFYGNLKRMHDRWTACIQTILDAEPGLEPSRILAQFMDNIPELKEYPSQWFSFQLSVNGIAMYLQKVRNPPR